MPRPFVFEPGVRYALQQDGEHTIGYEIMEILKQDNVLVRNVATQDDKSEVQSMQALRQALWAGKLKFGLPGRANLRKEAGVAVTTSYDFATLADLPEEVRTITENRFALVVPFLELTPRQRSDTYITEQVNKFIRQLLETSKPGAAIVLFGEHIGKGDERRDAQLMMACADVGDADQFDLVAEASPQRGRAAGFVVSIVGVSAQNKNVEWWHGSSRAEKGRDREGWHKSS